MFSNNHVFSAAYFIRRTLRGAVQLRGRLSEQAHFAATSRGPKVGSSS
jgi:hypothetical protein